MPYLLARGVAEAHLYILLHPCEECGENEFIPDASPGASGEDLVVRYAGRCPGCGTAREFTFRLLDGSPGDGTEFGGERPSELIDPGEWLWFADRLAATVPAAHGPGDDDPAQSAADARTAAAAVDEVLKFIPDNLDLVPFSAFTSVRGRAVYAEEPGRFRRVRLTGARDEFLRLSDRLLAPGAGLAADDGPVLDGDAFRIATVFDAVAPDGTATLGPDRERIGDAAERERLLGYLRSAPVAILVASRDVDRFQAERGRVVPMSFHTDGTWMWSDELPYYLELYGFAPEPALRAHIVAHDYRVPEVPADVLLAASRLYGGPDR